jgi:phosphopentomutase
MVLTADHGNHPTREGVPLIVIHDGESTPLGIRETFADVAAMLADFFGVHRARL